MECEKKNRELKRNKVIFILGFLKILNRYNHFENIEIFYMSIQAVKYATIFQILSHFLSFWLVMTDLNSCGIPNIVGPVGASGF